MRTFSELVQKVKESNIKKKIAIVAGHDEEVLKAVYDSQDIAEAVIFGDKKKVIKIAEEIGFENLGELNIVDVNNEAEAAKMAVEMVRNGEADVLMKGKIDTAAFLKAALDKEKGLNTGKLLSDVFIFEDIRENGEKALIGMTDGGVNLYPEMKEKIDIIMNAVQVFHKLGISKPKVALLAAVEVVNPKMPCTQEAAIITQMNRRGQIKDCIIDGPLAFDNAVSKRSAEIKGINSEVAGFADILVVPNIEAGNILGKCLTIYGQKEAGHIIMGATHPIIITSRSDTDKVKYNSIALSTIF